MWNLSLPWWEFVLRAVLVYGFLLLILRLTGKRQIGQMSPFDLVLLLVLSNAVQNSMNGGDNTVGGGFILAGTLVAFNALVSFITSRNRAAEKWVEGVPEVLVFDGKVMKKVLASEGLSMDELEGAMRAAGCDDVKDVHLATLELNGQISIVREDNPAGQSPKIYRISRSMRRKGRRSGYGG
jgi:uncharacterized membrane protein YcaP (DUF421 family)